MSKQSPQRPKQPPEQNPELEPLNRAELLVAMAATAIILLLVARIWSFFDPFRFPSALSWRDTGIGGLVGLGISAMSACTYQFWPAYKRSADSYLAFVLAPLFLSDSIWIGLLPGISEELLFRGVMLPALGQNATGLVISSLCFGVLHMSAPKQWPYAIWATSIGMVLGLSALLTGNLLVPIVAHVVTNFISSFFWQLSRSNKVS